MKCQLYYYMSIMSTIVGMAVFLRNISFHGILLDALSLEMLTGKQFTVWCQMGFTMAQ